jgi:hypothetical protein
MLVRAPPTRMLYAGELGPYFAALPTGSGVLTIPVERTVQMVFGHFLAPLGHCVLTNGVPHFVSLSTLVKFSLLLQAVLDHCRLRTRRVRKAMLCEC